MLRVRDIMTADVATVAPEIPVREAMDVLAKRRVSAAPVVTDGGRVVGIITASDLLMFASSQCRVSEAMTHTPLVTVSPAASAESAAALMRRHRVHRIVVLDGDRLAGIVSAIDIVTAVAEGRYAEREYVFNDDSRYVDP